MIKVTYNMPPRAGKLDFDVRVNIHKSPFRFGVSNIVQAHEIALLQFQERTATMEDLLPISSKRVVTSTPRILVSDSSVFECPFADFYLTDQFHKLSQGPLFFRHELPAGALDASIVDHTGGGAPTFEYQHDADNNVVYHNLKNEYDPTKGELKIAYIVKYRLGNTYYEEALKRDLIFQQATQHKAAYGTSDSVYFKTVRNNMTIITVIKSPLTNGVAVKEKLLSNFEIYSPHEADLSASWFVQIHSGKRVLR